MDFKVPHFQTTYLHVRVFIDIARYNFVLSFPYAVLSFPSKALRQAMKSKKNGKHIFIFPRTDNCYTGFADLTLVTPKINLEVDDFYQLFMASVASPGPLDA